MIRNWETPASVRISALRILRSSTSSKGARMLACVCLQGLTKKHHSQIIFADSGAILSHIWTWVIKRSRGSVDHISFVSTRSGDIGVRDLRFRGRVVRSFDPVIRVKYDRMCERYEDKVPKGLYVRTNKAVLGSLIRAIAKDKNTAKSGLTGQSSP